MEGGGGWGGVDGRGLDISRVRLRVKFPFWISTYVYDLLMLMLDADVGCFLHFHGFCLLPIFSSLTLLAIWIFDSPPSLALFHYTSV